MEPMIGKSRMIKAFSNFFWNVVFSFSAITSVTIKSSKNKADTSTQNTLDSIPKL